MQNNQDYIKEERRKKEKKKGRKIKKEGKKRRRKERKTEKGKKGGKKDRERERKAERKKRKNITFPFLKIRIPNLLLVLTTTLRSQFPSIRTQPERRNQIQKYVFSPYLLSD